MLSRHKAGRIVSKCIKWALQRKVTRDALLFEE
jgi:hypothetical protein